VQVGRYSASTVPKDRDLFGISSECSYVLLYPLQSQSLILETEIPWHVLIASAYYQILTGNQEVVYK